MRHKITPNEGERMPSLCVAMDCETTTEHSTRRPGWRVEKLSHGLACRFRLENGVVTRRTWFAFTQQQAFWAWLIAGLDPNKKTHLFCHNAGFDLVAAGLPDAVDAGLLRPAVRWRAPPVAGDEDREDTEPQGLLVMDDPPTIIELEDKRGRKLLCLDLMNWFPVKLEQIGEQLGVPKLARPGDEATEEYRAAYVERDVEIVVQAVAQLVGFLRENECGNFRHTLSQQAYALYRHRCLDEPVSLGHNVGNKTLERAAYFGGLVRPFYVGKVLSGIIAHRHTEQPRRQETAMRLDGPVTRLDVNSCYPHVMRENDYPISFRYGEVDMAVGDLVEQLGEGEGVADVGLRTLNHPYPIRENGLPRWCVGTFRTALCGPELRRALALGHVRHVYRAQLYTRGRPFDTFCAVVLAMRARYRASGQRLWEDASKHLANALHGVLAMRAQRWTADLGMLPAKRWGRWADDDPQRDGLTTYRAFGGYVERQLDPAERNDSFPLLSAYVTAYAREHVWALMEDAGRENVLYVDADSIHVASDGLERLRACGWLDPTRPGALKIVEQVTHAEYRGPKFYRLGDSWTLAGAPPGIDPELSGEFTRQEIFGLATCLNGTPPEGPLVADRVVLLPQTIFDGTLSANGMLAFPVKLG